MDTTKFWVLLTIVGFVYVTSFFFFFLLLSASPSLTFFDDLKGYLPYISAIIVPTSYMFGFVSHILVNEFIVPRLLHRYFFKRPKDLEDQLTQEENKLLVILQFGSQLLINDVKQTWGIFVSFRLLFVAFWFLGIFALPWLNQSIYHDAWSEVLFLWIFILFATAWTYLTIKDKPRQIFDESYKTLKSRGGGGRSLTGR